MGRINTNVSSLIAQRALAKNNSSLNTSLQRLSTEEVNANQLQADSILATINRIAQSTSFQGKQLLNGNYAYSTSSVAGSKIGDVEVNAATLADGSTKAVVINVAQSAQTATVGYTGGAVATGGVTIEIAGNNGTQQLSFGSGTTVAQIITGINAVKTATGVSAAASGSDARFDSQGFGSKQFVSVKLITGAFTTTANQDFGRDATVSVNGATAQADGLNVSYRDAGLDVAFNLKSGINSTNGTTTFYVTGGGAKFALGSKVTETDKASIGISSVSTGSLGDASNGFLSTLGSGQTNSLSSNNLVTSQKIIDKAIKQVSQLRGRLGAFQKFTIGSTINSLGVAYENVSASESAIVDTDFAEETAQLTRSQILSQAASTVLAQANATPQNALALLRG